MISKNFHLILLVAIFFDIFLIKKINSKINVVDSISYHEKKDFNYLLSQKISELNVTNRNITKILKILERFDIKNAPKKVVVDGKIKYTYRKLQNEPPKTIEEIERLIKNPIQTRKYEVFIQKALLTLLSNEIRILIKDLPESEPSGQWIYKDKMLIINEKILKEGTIKFAYLLSHEMIHIAQSCKGGSFGSYPTLLGLELKKPKNYYYKYLNNEIYKNLTKDEVVLEIEAYGNQSDVSQTMNAFKYFCLRQK